MTALALPTRRDEAWRYSDLDAVAAVWPTPAPERITVPAGERATRYLIQDAPDGATAIHDHNVVIEAGARLDFHLLNTGGMFGRVTLEVTLHEGAHFEFGAVQLGGGEQNLEIVTIVRHVEPNATSRQTIRSVLAGQATGSYLGKIAVAQAAQKTDAGQSVKAILLARTATANAKPELEIYADDVKCAHGATVGELDKQALFYLASRGLAPADARKLLLQAFIAEVFEHATAREDLETAALATLDRLS